MSQAVRSEMKIVEEPKKPISMHPKKFAMWLFIASVGMLFASLTSAYIVRRAEGNWLYFDLPSLFYYSTWIIIVSSATLQWAYFAAKKDNLKLVRTLVAITSILGVLFLTGQFLGWWVQMADSGVHLVGNPSGSFVIVIAFLHGLHVVSAVIFLLIVLNSAVRMRINSKNMAQMEMCTTYWHFLGVLWILICSFFFSFIDKNAIGN